MRVKNAGSAVPVADNRSLPFSMKLRVMKPPSLSLATFVAVVTLGVGSAGAVTILSTDFAGRTVSGKTASDIAWTTNGVQDPGDLTWVQEGGGPTTTSLFDTADAQGHFAPDMNIDNEGPWSASISLTTTAPQIVLENVVLDWQHFNNGGAFQSVARSADWTVSVTGSLSGLLGSVTATDVNAISGTETLTFASPLSLDGSETYDVNVFVAGNGPGNNTGLDAINLNGQVVPEPSGLLLAAFGLSGLLGRRRRAR